MKRRHLSNSYSYGCNSGPSDGGGNIKTHDPFEKHSEDNSQLEHFTTASAM